MVITDAKYHARDADNSNPNVSINCKIDGKVNLVPMSVGNLEFDEIMRQVAAGELTIQDAD